MYDDGERHPERFVDGHPPASKVPSWFVWILFVLIVAAVVFAWIAAGQPDDLTTNFG